jgi:hypothetical protein
MRELELPIVRCVSGAYSRNGRIEIKLKRCSTAALSLFLAAGLAGCGDSTGPEEPVTLKVALTDGPAKAFKSAMVNIGEVWAIQAGRPPIRLTEDGGEYDLLALQHGVMAEIASAEIPASRLLQLRLHIDSAQVELHADYMFEDGTRMAELFVPSGAQSGIKVNLRDADGNEDGAGVDLVPGETILAVVDMDVEQNFVFRGSTDDPMALPEVLFTPLLRATLEDVAGSISGTVTYVSPPAQPDDSTEYASIDAELMTSAVEVEEMETLTASADAKPDGTYTIYFLSPGTYDVIATATIDGTLYPVVPPAPKSVVVGDGQNVTGVDFSL